LVSHALVVIATLQDAKSSATRSSVVIDVIRQPVRTVGTREPFKLPDPFFALEEYLHPQDPRLQTGLFFISDSCRLWRDESLL